MRNLKHKFKAKQQSIDKINFSSKLEARYYQKLKLLQSSGEILFFLMQVPFHLPGSTTYRLDFMEFHSDGSVVLTECKGYDTNLGKLKIKQVEDLYNVQINVVRKA